MWTLGLDLHQRLYRFAGGCLCYSATERNWGGRPHLQRLQTIHSRRAIYFAFNHHRLVPRVGIEPTTTPVKSRVSSQVELPWYGLGACPGTRTQKTLVLNERCLPSCIRQA